MRVLQEDERIAREAKEADEKTMSKKPGKSHGFVFYTHAHEKTMSKKLGKSHGFVSCIIFPLRLRTVAGETRVVAKMWD